MAHLFEPIAEQDTQIEKSWSNWCGTCTKQVIQRELAMDSTQIEHVMREALKLLPLGVDNVRLYINPQDFEQVKALRERHEETWRIVEDESLLPGGCRVETEHSRIDATVETRVTQVMDKLFDQLARTGLAPGGAGSEHSICPAQANLREPADVPMRLERTSFAKRLGSYAEAIETGRRTDPRRPPAAHGRPDPRSRGLARRHGQPLHGHQR